MSWFRMTDRDVHYEHEDPNREGREAMERHFYNIGGRAWVKEDLQRFLRSLMSSPPDIEANMQEVKLWTGNIGAYWKTPGELKNYVTLIVRYGSYILAYEQDNPIDMSGYFRLFHNGVYVRV